MISVLHVRYNITVNKKVFYCYAISTAKLHCNLWAVIQSVVTPILTVHNSKPNVLIRVGSVSLLPPDILTESVLEQLTDLINKRIRKYFSSFTITRLHLTHRVH